MSTLTYKDMNLKLRYKDYETFSIPETDTDTILKDETYSEEKRIFRQVDEDTFNQIKLEFNSFLLPCNSGIYLSKYSKFDDDKLEKFRNYRMAKSNFNQKGRIDNYYKFFLLMNLMIRLKQIPDKPDITKIYLEKYLKFLDYKRVILNFNFTEMLSLNYHITQNFCAAPNLKASAGVLEHMTILLKDYKPLYRIEDMYLYVKDRKNYISDNINNRDKYFLDEFLEYDLKAPGVKTGFLKEEKFVINKTMFYDFNHYMFNKNAKIRNFYYRNLFKKIRECFVNDKYDFIASKYYKNKNGDERPLCMVREYSFEIKERLARYTVEELLGWFLKFYNYYNYLGYRYKDLLIIQSNTSFSNFLQVCNPFKIPPQTSIINTNKITSNCIYHYISPDNCGYSICRFYDFNRKKDDHYTQYNDKIFNKYKFDYDRLYINSKEGYAIFEDIFSKFNIKRNFKSNKLIMFRTDNFHVISPTAVFLYNLYKAKRYEVNQATIIKMDVMGNDHCYRDRLSLWKNPDYLKIAGFSVVVSAPILNSYHKKIFDTINEENTPIKDLILFLDKNTTHIHHYVKKFYSLKELTCFNTPRYLCKMFSMENIIEYFNKNNQILVSYLQFNKNMTNSNIFLSLILPIKIPNLYPLDFYTYINHKYANNNFYQINEELLYDYYLFKRNQKHYFKNIAYTENNKMAGEILHNFNLDSLTYHMCILNLILFKGIKFPLGDDFTWIPKSPYDLFLCQFVLDNYQYKNNISNLKNKMTEALFFNSQNIYENIYKENSETYNLFDNYFNNKIDKNSYYPDVDSYYGSVMYNNDIYDLMYNYIPHNNKKFKTFFYERYNKGNINSMDDLYASLNSLGQEEITRVFTEYVTYCLMNTYLRTNYNIYMRHLYENKLPKGSIDTYDNYKEYIIEINNKRYIFNKPENPNTDLVIYLEENFVIENTFMEFEENILKEFERYCDEFINDEELLLEYKEKEAEEFEEFKRRLFQWEKFGYYEITV